MAWIAVAAVADLPDGRAVPVELAGRRVAVVRVGERVFAVEDRCAHRGFPLHDGSVAGTVIRCRTHGSCFALDSGAVVRGPARRPVRAYAVTIEDGAVLVEV